MQKNQTFIKRFGYALNGIVLVFKSENSFRTQIIFAVVGMALLAFLAPPLIWWALLGITIAGVLALELFNSAIEQLCDLLHPDQCEQIKFIKDAAAGGVLIMSFASLWVGLMLLLNHFYPT